MTETLRADVAVVGLGAMGAMTAWQLGSAGASVVGIEQFAIAHAKGSSHGGSRIFRTILPEGPAYVPIGKSSLKLWRELERESGTALLRMTGGIFIGTEGGSLMTHALASAESRGVPHSVLDCGEIRSRFPQHAVVDDDVAVYEEQSGVLHPEKAISAAIGLAEKAGASILTETRVVGLEVNDRGVEIGTDRGRVLAKTAVIATGAWFNDLVPELSLPLSIYRSPLCWFAARNPEEYRPDRFPVFVRASDRMPHGWGIPDVDGRGVKVGVLDQPKPSLDRPEDNWRPVTAEDTDPPIAFCREAFPDLIPTGVQAEPCMNSKTPDGDFIVGIPAAAPQLVLLGGFSGHGFKHATGIARIATELALGQGTSIPIEQFSPERFGAGSG